MSMDATDPDASYRKGLRKNRRVLIGSAGVLVFLMLIALVTGRYPAPGLTSPSAIGGDLVLARIILDVRLPRVLLAVAGGASLAVAGFVFQMLFANPLVEPGFLGVSQGAAFGAALAIVVSGYSMALIQVSATVFGLAGLAASYVLAKAFRFGGWILRLVLAGIAMSAVFSSGLSVIKLVADPTTSLQDITFWMMGGLWNTTWKTVFSVFPAMLLGMTLLVTGRWRINVLSLDDRSAHAIGLHPAREKTLYLLGATVATTAVISVAGLVGWVGLIIPHVARRVLGSDARHALPGSMLFGALFLLLCDTVGRSLLSGEIPLGIITSFVGAVVFMVLLVRKGSEVRW